MKNAAGILIGLYAIAILVQAVESQQQLRFTRKPLDADVQEGGSVVLSCKFNGNAAGCFWKRNKVVIFPAAHPGRYDFVGRPSEGDCSLRISKATYDADYAYWTCQVSQENEDRLLLPSGAVLYVQTDLYNPGKRHPLRIIEKPLDVDVKAGESVVLPCRFNGDASGCHWERGGEVIATVRGVYEFVGRPSAGDCSLRIVEASFANDYAHWTCQLHPDGYLWELWAGAIVRVQNNYWFVVFTGGDTKSSAKRNGAVNSTKPTYLLMTLILLCGAIFN